MVLLFWLMTFVSTSWYASEIVCTGASQDILVIGRVFKLLKNVWVAKGDVNPDILTRGRVLSHYRI